MLELILKDIEDPYVRENFFRLNRFLNGQVLFEGDFKLFDVDIDLTKLDFKIKHGLTFIPQDIILLSVQGDFNFFFNYQAFDREYIYISAAGPCRIRFLAGKLSDKVGINRRDKYPLVSPGATTLVPGPAGRIVWTYATDLITAVNDMVIVSGINTVSKISSNNPAIIPNGILGFVYSKPTLTTAEVIFAGPLSGFGGFSPGAALFVSPSGTLTQVPPSTGMVQQVAMATSASDIVVNLMLPMRRA